MGYRRTGCGVDYSRHERGLERVVAPAGIDNRCWSFCDRRRGWDGKVVESGRCSLNNCCKICLSMFLGPSWCSLGGSVRCTVSTSSPPILPTCEKYLADFPSHSQWPCLPKQRYTPHTKTIARSPYSQGQHGGGVLGELLRLYKNPWSTTSSVETTHSTHS